MDYSVLIVDDDRRTRDGLLKYIEWNQHGFDRPLAAPGAREALEILKHHRIDLLITDIKMPEISGLELCARVTAAYGNTLIVILSGYGDFEYAKTAMQYGVKYYITKPTDLDRFREILLRVKAELDQNRSKLEQTKKIERQYTNTVELLIEKLFVDLALGMAKPDTSATQFLTDHNISFQYAYFAILTVAAREDPARGTDGNNQQPMDDWLKKIINLSAVNLEILYYFFRNQPNQLHIVVNFDNSGLLSQLATKIIADCRQLANIRVEMAVSDKVTGLEHLPVCYRQNQGIFALNKFDANHQVIDFQQINNDFELSYFKESEKLLLTCIISNNQAEAFATIDKIFRDLDEKNVCIEMYQEYFIKLFFAIEAQLMEFNLSIKDVADTKIFPFQKVLEFPNQTEMLLWLKKLIAQAINRVNSGKTPYSFKIVEQIKAYLKTNFTREITLVSASDAIHLSPAYISKIFKKATGLSFIEYLTLLRVGRAKQLLKDENIKVYEIGDRVGYKNTKHFSQVFKSITGLTPSEYRENVKYGQGSEAE